MSDAKVKKLADLSLLLLFLSGWEEESRQFPGEKVFRAWKGFLFTTLNDLCENNFLTQFKNTKSVILTPAGIERAKKLGDMGTPIPLHKNFPHRNIDKQAG